MNKESPLFSVLIANYNNGKFLLEAINSVINQSYENWEIIIVDDCSTDYSLKIYNEIEKNDKIKIISNDKNRGCGYTKNRCIIESSGEICGFLDPDDALLNNALEVMVNEHLIHTQASLIYSNHYLCDENLNINSLSLRNGPIEQSYIHSAFVKDSNIISHFASFKRSLYSKTDHINKNLKRAVDQDLYYKLEEVGEVKYVDIPLYKYRIHNNGISTLKNQLKAKYWHLLTIEDAYKRRKSCGTLNISKELLIDAKSKYHYNKAFEKFNSKEYCKMYNQFIISQFLRRRLLTKHDFKILLTPFIFWRKN